MFPLSDLTLLLLLGLGVASYLVVGLTPFEFDFSRRSPVYLVFLTPLNSVLNWLCFVPLGLLVAGLSFVERPVIVAVLVFGLLSLLVEALQLFVPGRFCVVSDWILNTAGAASGALLASVLGKAS